MKGRISCGCCGSQSVRPSSARSGPCCAQALGNRPLPPVVRRRPIGGTATPTSEGAMPASGATRSENTRDGDGRRQRRQREIA
ncbi:Hypothetical protein NTJ_08764 [Nesidiocoris tenuis]|nr:Hypothetical protein NTJ_08764 [Nesidiocoris tenuis]